MKGKLNKTGKNWSVLYFDSKLNSTLKLVVSPESLSDRQLSTYWVDGREVEFDIVDSIPTDLEPTRGKTLAFELVRQAKIIVNDDISDWDVTLMDGLEDEEWETNIGSEIKLAEQMIHMAAKEYSNGAWNERQSYASFIAGAKYILKQLTNSK